MSGRLEGRVALITGAASGMGAAAATRFVAEGARVVIADRDLVAGRAHAASLGPRAEAVELDVVDPEAWRRVVDVVLARHGRIDVLFNNAGVHGAASLERTTRELWTRTLDVDAYGVVLGIQAVAGPMRAAGGGSIITTSSLQGLEADVRLLPYVAAKSAVRGIGRAAALELGRDGIRVNTIFPGAFRTPMNDGMPDEAFGFVPLRRADRPGVAGLPEDIGGVAVFLASDAAAYVSGAEIVVDGGKSARFATIVEDTRSARQEESA
jgi:3alpha(or 20beta)-hydroxysteroid dehydrogenase